MSKKILVLYFSPKYKAEIAECENIFKALMRKFRKSVLFSYIQIDTSPSCLESLKSLLSEEIKKYDAVLISGEKETCSEKETFTKEVLGLFAAEYHCAGRAICFPSSNIAVTSENGCIIEERRHSHKNIQKAAELSLTLAKSRKHSLTVCTQADNKAERLMFTELEYALGAAPYIQAEYISFDEIISLCMSTIPSFDVVLTTEQTAKIIAMHLNSSKRSPSGYLLMHTEYGRIYGRQLFPHEEINNTASASILLAFSALLENELMMKSASDWLKKTVAAVFEEYAYAPQKEFTDRIILEIEKPMRQHKRYIK